MGGTAGLKACCGDGHDCSWISKCGSKGCRDCKNDGSAGYQQCCGITPSPPSPPPTPPPSPPPTPPPSPPPTRPGPAPPTPPPSPPPTPPGPAPPSGLTAYCPNTANDFN